MILWLNLCCRHFTILPLELGTLILVHFRLTRLNTKKLQKNYKKPNATSHPTFQRKLIKKNLKTKQNKNPQIVIFFLYFISKLIFWTFQCRYLFSMRASYYLALSKNTTLRIWKNMLEYIVASISTHWKKTVPKYNIHV